MRIFCVRFLLGLMLTGTPHVVFANEEVAVREALIDLYSAANTGDIERIAYYYLPSGLREFTLNGGALVNVNLDTMRNYYSKGLKSDVSLHNIEVQVIGSAAYATYYRIGIVDFAGSESPQPKILRVTSVWVKKDHWYIVHIHNSEKTSSG